MIGNTIAAGTARMKSPAQSRRDAVHAWPGWCEAAAVRFVGSPGGYDTAAQAYAASRIVSTDPAAAPAGTVHWWTDGGDGHVSVSLGRGETFMASSWVTPDTGTVWHPGLGVVHVAAYTAAHRTLTYRGWSYDLAGTVMKDAVVLVRVPGETTIWQLTPTLHRTKVSTARAAILRRRGVTPVTITQARLASFRAA